MPPGMNGPEISEWVTDLDGVHELVRATAAAGSRADAEATIAAALAALEDLHARMLRAEVRAVFATRTAAGR
jgi:hypothetical protein